ncbi:MerR family transcriptional regulator [Thalassococcus sp. S3]|uniref:MerR family transcriptional regulator n=1 Tax=Thalassococcus sp. S3 TaxID=2017482 RepID=UPI001024006E|nr:MerR family transcriptional regulator [Thalassococcus sp. S3]QBF32835.1 MerR family transcriptional regulator [Thalassococcus sp. S3]
MQIGDLSDRSGVSRDALRLYERRGLIRADRKANGYRDFPKETEAVVGLIRLAQALGFSLREISELVGGNQAEMDAEAVADLLRAKLAEIDDKVARLLQLRGMLEARLANVCPLGLGGRARVS